MVIPIVYGFDLFVTYGLMNILSVSIILFNFAILTNMHQETFIYLLLKIVNLTLKCYKYKYKYYTVNLFMKLYIRYIKISFDLWYLWFLKSSFLLLYLKYE